MISEQQRERARQFTALHHGKELLVLPNAWDAGSAMIFEKQGFPAVATTSAGIAYALGRPDGQTISFSELLTVVRQMVSCLHVPLSVDFERGYGDTPQEVQERARDLLEAGAVGLNLEDGLSDGTLTPLPEQLEKIRALTALKRELDLEFVLNARTCAYWLHIGDEETMLQTALERGKAFAEAGADCVFVPGVMGKETVQALVQGIPAPVNIILNGKFHDFAELNALGVRRLSVGSGPVRAVLGQTIALADALRQGNADAILSSSFSYGDANRYFA